MHPDVPAWANTIGRPVKHVYPEFDHGVDAAAAVDGRAQQLAVNRGGVTMGREALNEEKERRYRAPVTPKAGLSSRSRGSRCVRETGAGPSSITWSALYLVEPREQRHHLMHGYIRVPRSSTTEYGFG